MTNFRTPYPKYDVLRKQSSPSWDGVTREVVRRRLTSIPPRRFFTPEEWETLEAICERLLPQPERDDARIPIPPWVDQQLHDQRSEGYRHHDMPPLRDAWRTGLRAIEDESRIHHQERFPKLTPAEGDRLLRGIQVGEVHSELWRAVPPQRFFREFLLRTVVGIYYAHPAAWSEIGYGGPASPRGYVRLGLDQRDPWEAKEHRG